MRVPLEWLGDFVEVRLRPEELAERLTMAGLEVGAIEYHGKGIEKVVVGKIKSVEKLPSDHHLLCQIDIGRSILQVITEDLSLKGGEKVPVALVGAKIARGLIIEKTELHGVEAFGYLCRPHELGLYEEQYVLRLPKDAVLGEDVRKYIGLGGCVLDIDVLPNRGDCLSILGVAREISAVTGIKLKNPKSEIRNPKQYRNSKFEIKIEVKDKELCPRYMARMVEGIEVKESPEWLKNRLLLAGLRPINNIVDVTNYLLIELGQPLHAFDASLIGGQKIIVRRAGSGEKLKTLDGVGRKLEKDMLVIADAERAIALAGVMGGANTEVSGSTTAIVLESAYFNPVSINKTSKEIKLRTESSIRFEKGVDWEMVEASLECAARMIAELAGGKVLSGRIDIKSRERKPKVLELRQERLNKVLGIKVPLREALKILEKLNFRKVKLNSKKLKVKVPTWREGDIEQEIDLIEEIARLNGYDKIKTSMPQVREEAVENNRQVILRRIREVLTGCGLFEAQTFSLVDPKMADEEALRIRNPLTPEESVLRTDMVPSLLKAVSYNLRHQAEEVQLFEIGSVYLLSEPAAERRGSEKVNREVYSQVHFPDEKLVLAGALAGGGVDFYQVKGVLDNLLSEFSLSYKLETTMNRKYHPGKSAAIILGSKNKLLGQFGQLHPEMQKKWDLTPEVYIFEVDLIALSASYKADKRYKSLPKYPKVDRDIAMFVPRGITSGTIIATIKETGGELVEDVQLFDEYKNSQAYRISFRDAQKTLTDEVVNQMSCVIQDELTGKLKVQIRK